MSFLNVIKSKIKRKILSSVKSQNFLESFFFSRFFVKKEALELFNLLGGFVYSQTLLAFVKLKFVEILSDGPLERNKLKKNCGLKENEFNCLIKSAVAVGLLEKSGDDVYELSTKGLILSTNPGLVALVKHHEIFYRDLIDPVSLLNGTQRSTELRSYWPYSESENELEKQNTQVQNTSVANRYSELMSVSQPLVTDQVFKAYNFNKHKNVLDLGGGNATFLVNLSKKYPHLKMTAFDLGVVKDAAIKKIKKARMDTKISFVAGDFFESNLPTGHDLITLIRVLYDHSDEKVMKLLKSVKKSIMPGGVLLVAEPMAEIQNSKSNHSDAYFSFYLLAMGKGKPRSKEQLKKMLLDSGFSTVESLNTNLPIQTGIMLAKS